MKTLTLATCAFLFAPMLLLTSCCDARAGGGPDAPSRPLSSIVEDEDNAFEKGMVQTGLVDALGREGPYTLFVPDTDAFPRVLQEVGLTEDEFLQLGNFEEILGYHIVISVLEYPDYEAGATVETLAGSTLKLRATDQEHAFVNDVKLTSVLNDTTLNTNGEYEVIDGLLLPPGVLLQKR